MSAPKVTVVIPAYNHEEYIAASIQSVLDQGISNLELSVLDDGSTDSTFSVAERALENPGPVRVRLERQANAGASRTLNRLIEHSDTDFVAILNSDDVFAPGRLRVFLDQPQENELCFAFSGIEFIDDAAESGEQDQFREWYRSKFGVAARLPTCGFAQLAGNLAVTSSNFFFSRQLFDVVGGFDEDMQFSQDWDFSLRVLRWVEPHFFPQRLLKYRIHPDNSWRKLAEVRNAQLHRALEKYAEWARDHCPNSLAPVPNHWPRFYPIFSRSAGTWVDDAPIGENLPESMLEPVDDSTDANPSDTAALRQFLQGTGEVGGNETNAGRMLVETAERWSGSRRR